MCADLAVGIFSGRRVQAAYAYSVISNQAANVVGVMDKMWSGANGDSNGQLQQQGLPSLAGASEQQQQARLAMALSDPGDSEGVYIQVSSCHN